MHKSVEVACCFLDLFAELVASVQVEDIGHKIQGILIIGNLRVQARKVEAIGKVFFVDLAEVLVPAG